MILLFCVNIKNQSTPQIRTQAWIWFLWQQDRWALPTSPPRLCIYNPHGRYLPRQRNAQQIIYVIVAFVPCSEIILNALIIISKANRNKTFPTQIHKKLEAMTTKSNTIIMNHETLHHEGHTMAANGKKMHAFSTTDPHVKINLIATREKNV